MIISFDECRCKYMKKLRIMKEKEEKDLSFVDFKAVTRRY